MRLNSPRARRRPTRIELSMTSMIDVVFLLLIFFLVTTTFVRPERQLLSNLHRDSGSAPQQASDLQPAVITITRDGDRVVFQLGAIRTERLTELRSPLEQFDNKQDGAFVRVANGVPFEAAAQAIGLCRGSGFVSVAYVPSD